MRSWRSREGWQLLIAQPRLCRHPASRGIDLARKFLHKHLRPIRVSVVREYAGLASARATGRVSGSKAEEDK